MSNEHFLRERRWPSLCQTLNFTKHLPLLSCSTVSMLQNPLPINSSSNKIITQISTCIFHFIYQRPLKTHGSRAQGHLGLLQCGVTYCFFDIGQSSRKDQVSSVCDWEWQKWNSLHYHSHFRAEVTETGTKKPKAPAGCSGAGCPCHTLMLGSTPNLCSNFSVRACT